MQDEFVPAARPALAVLAVVSFVGVALAPDALTARVAGQMPPFIELTATIRDFKGHGQPGGHLDFERTKKTSSGGLTCGALRPWLNWDRKPIFVGGTKVTKIGSGVFDQWEDSAGRYICYLLYDPIVDGHEGTFDPARPSAFTTAANFDQWYRDVPGVNLSMPITLTLNLQADGTYVYDDKDDPVYGNGGFFPIDGQLFGNSLANASHNFHFTTEIHAAFVYDASAGQIFKFTGDDDVWVFINGELVIELGGTHYPLEQFVDLTRLGLVDGGSYTMDLFHAERQTNGSNFRFQTNLVLTNTPITTTIPAFD